MSCFWLQAVAGEAQCHFVYTSGSHFDEVIVGVGMVRSVGLLKGSVGWDRVPDVDCGWMQGLPESVLCSNTRVNMCRA